VCSTPSSRRCRCLGDAADGHAGSAECAVFVWAAHVTALVCVSPLPTLTPPQGFCYRMRLAYAHFPINVSIVGSGPGSLVEIRNYLGQRIVRRIKMLEGVSVTKSTDVKDQLELIGNDIELVSRSGA
jgi:hypothetical protein